MRGQPKKIRLAAGVQFGPEGLALAKAATLMVQTSRAAGARALAWYGLGKDISRYPSTRAGSQVKLRVVHFSGVGTAVGPGAAWNGVPTATTALRVRYAADVLPVMKRALRLDQVAGVALSSAFGWLRQVELLGLGGEFKAERAEILALLPKILQNALDKASDRCAAHDLTQAERMLKIERLAGLFGIHVAGASALERARRCLHFELDYYDSHTAVVIPSATADTHVTATVKLEVSSDLSRISGSATLQHVGGGHSACSPATGHGSQPLVVADLDIDLGASAPGVMLEMHPGMVESTVACGNSPSPNGYTYFPVFAFLHRAETDNGYASFKLGSWAWVGGATVATKTYERTEPVPNSGESSFTETTTLVLRHTPES